MNEDRIRNALGVRGLSIVESQWIASPASEGLPASGCFVVLAQRDNRHQPFVVLTVAIDPINPCDRYNYASKEVARDAYNRRVAAFEHYASHRGGK